MGQIPCSSHKVAKVAWVLKLGEVTSLSSAHRAAQMSPRLVSMLLLAMRIVVPCLSRGEPRWPSPHSSPSSAIVGCNTS